MTRKKVNLAYIANDSARKATFKKRKNGLLKKVSELSTLCGVDACAIIYSPYDTEPEVWPSPLGLQRVLSRFKQMPEMEQIKKMLNQETFLRQRIVKASDQLKKQRKDNREKEVTQVMFQGLTGKSLCNLTMIDLNDLGWLIDQNLKEIHKKVDELKHGRQQSTTPQATIASVAGPSGEPAPPLPIENPVVDVNMEALQRQWMMDLMNPQEHTGFGGDDMFLPFGDSNHKAFWSNSFFP